MGGGAELKRCFGGEDFHKPYSPPCVERENVFEFTEKPAVKYLGDDKYELTFAVKGNCDVTVGIIDEKGVVVRHLASGVLGSNAPAPFQKNSLKQKIYWDGKCDLEHYPRDPGKLRVRVMLGLKPTFDKRLRGTSPKNVAGCIFGVGLAEDGAYVIMKGDADWGHVTLRKLDREGNYLGTLVPPPAAQPLEKLAGDGYVEYEPGKRVWHGRDLYQAIAHDGFAVPNAHGKGLARCQVAVVGDRIIYASGGDHPFSAGAGSCLHWFHKDGSTSLAGLDGKRKFAWGRHAFPMLAASPDEKTLYMVSNVNLQGDGFRPWEPVLVRAPADGSAPATILVGEKGKPGSDNAHLNGTTGLDVDAAGRIYVSDSGNNRVQIFAPDGKHLKTIPVDRPQLLRVHQKTGAIYVQHAARAQGQSHPRLTKFASFDAPTEEFHVDGLGSSVMALDSWSVRPRLWLAGSAVTTTNRGKTTDAGPSVRIYEESDKTFKLVLDFDEEAKKEDGENFDGRWCGDIWDKVACDPVREQVYYRKSVIFDLATGARKGSWHMPGSTDDIAFDKYGYMHGHFNPCFFMQGVARFDPTRAETYRDWQKRPHEGVLAYPECPYDYGIEKGQFLGILPTRCQPGSKGFQDGIGVTMRGDVVVQSNIYYVPKMEEEGFGLAAAGILERTKRGEYSDAPMRSYANYMKTILEAEQRGEEVYFIRRQPGIPLAGATAWTFDRHGELINGPAVVAGKLMAGVQMDEDGFLYFVNSRPRRVNGKSFLSGKAGWNGATEKSDIFTGTLIKTQPTAKFLSQKAAIPMSEPLPRAPELVDSYGGEIWVEDAEWLYAGASPIVAGGCSCPSNRLHLDWYKRVYVPEAYRHSMGILDVNGNLIMHLGRYGNFDDAPGGKNGIKPGGTDVGMMTVRFISGTDNYVVFDDWGEKLVVMKLNYHAEEIVPIKMK